MNRLLCRRYAVNIFWTVIYGCLVGYVFYANYATRLNPVATLEPETLAVVAAGGHGNGSAAGGSGENIVAAFR